MHSFLFLLFLTTKDIFPLFFDLLLIFGLVGAWPVDAQLLAVDDNIAFDDFIFVLLDFLLIHGLNLVVPFEVGLFEVFELALEFFELTCDTFIFCSEIFVMLLEGLVGTIIFLT